MDSEIDEKTGFIKCRKEFEHHTDTMAEPVLRAAEPEVLEDWLPKSLDDTVDLETLFSLNVPLPTPVAFSTPKTQSGLIHETYVEGNSVSSLEVLVDKKSVSVTWLRGFITVLMGSVHGPEGTPVEITKSMVYEVMANDPQMMFDAGRYKKMLLEGDQGKYKLLIKDSDIRRSTR